MNSEIINIIFAILCIILVVMAIIFFATFLIIMIKDEIGSDKE